MTPFRCLILLPILTVLLGVWLTYHAGGPPPRYGSLIGQRFGPVHIGMTVEDCTPGDWLCEIEQGRAITFNRKHGVQYAGK